MMRSSTFIDIARKTKRFIMQRVFILRGKKPWTLGYNEYKQNTIREYIADDVFSEVKLCKGYGFRIDERVIEYPWFMANIPAGDGVILDAGSALNFNFLLDNKKLKEKKRFISTLSPERYSYPDKNTSYIYEDLRRSCFKDGFFDYIVSISTIEHIGLDNTMLYTDDSTKKENDSRAYLQAIEEFKRMLKPGGKLYITVPYGVYKNHLWFQVFNAEMLDGIIAAFSPAALSEHIFKYEPTGWVVSSRKEAEHEKCFDINISREYAEDFAAFSRAVACIEMTKG